MKGLIMRTVTIILIILSLMGCRSGEKSVEQDWPNLKYYKSKNLELGSPKTVSYTHLTLPTKA